jgi:hypothetical protein
VSSTSDLPTIFQQGSTFASRKAEAEARNAERGRTRWVSLGTREVRLPGVGREGVPRIVKVEYASDRDHPARVYAREVGTANFEPVNEIHGKEDQRQDLGTVSRSAYRQTYGSGRTETSTPLDEYEG